jgi:glycerol-1-phosphate dehydrogenase [NAD(P)+]
MAACLTRHNLPRTPAEVGLTDEQFVEAVAFAPRTRPDRYTIIEHLDLSPEEIRDKLAEYTHAVAG